MDKYWQNKLYAIRWIVLSTLWTTGARRIALSNLPTTGNSTVPCNTPYTLNRRVWKCIICIKCSRPHYGGEIWQRKSNQSFVISVWGKLGRRNHITTVKYMSSFSKSSIFKMFPVNNETLIRHFEIPPVWRAFSNSSVSVTDQRGLSLVFLFIYLFIYLDFYNNWT